MIGASHFFELAVATVIALYGPESGVWPSRQWGLFDPEHGYAWGTPTLCDVDVPETHCLTHDGFTIIRELDGKVGRALLMSSDDVTVLAQPASLIPALSIEGLIGLGALRAVAAG